jgi:DNA polymerase-3 subunit chi
MPQVEFHTGVASPLHFACRLLRKAWRQGVAVVVTAPPPALAALDRELWTFEPLEFVPHLRVAPGQPAGPALRRTAVWLCEGAVPRPGPQVLVNLGADLAEDLDLYQRVIEIVPPEDGPRQLARARWRRFEASGWPIRHHAQPAATAQPEP